MAPSECAAYSGVASVLHPAPTILSSHVRVNREPASRDVGGENSDNDGSYDGGDNEAEGKGKSRDRDDSDEDGDEGEGEGEDGNDNDDDDDMDEEMDVSVLCIGPPRGRSGSRHFKSVT